MQLASTQLQLDTPCNVQATLYPFQNIPTAGSTLIAAFTVNVFETKNNAWGV
jgi:hypothetical protein